MLKIYTKIILPQQSNSDIWKFKNASSCALCLCVCVSMLTVYSIKLKDDRREKKPVERTQKKKKNPEDENWNEQAETTKSYEQ